MVEFKRLETKSGALGQFSTEGAAVYTGIDLQEYVVEGSVCSNGDKYYLPGEAMWMILHDFHGQHVHQCPGPNPQLMVFLKPETPSRTSIV